MKLPFLSRLDVVLTCPWTGFRDRPDSSKGPHISLVLQWYLVVYFCLCSPLQQHMFHTHRYHTSTGLHVCMCGMYILMCTAVLIFFELNRDIRPGVYIFMQYYQVTFVQHTPPASQPIYLCVRICIRKKTKSYVVYHSTN